MAMRPVSFVAKPIVASAFVRTVKEPAKGRSSRSRASFPACLMARRAIFICENGIFGVEFRPEAIADCFSPALARRGQTSSQRQTTVAGDEDHRGGPATGRSDHVGECRIETHANAPLAQNIGSGFRDRIGHV